MHDQTRICEPQLMCATSYAVQQIALPQDHLHEHEQLCLKLLHV